MTPLGVNVRAVAGTLALLSAGAACASSEAQRLNGFSLSPAGIPVEEILAGGPPRDGIAALDHPAALAAGQAPWDDEELVIGVTWNGAARAYPLALLEYHELVNDTLAGRPILVSYCPLCGTGLVFDRRVDGAPRRFGVSGLLYQSDLLMYDRESESLWSQISAEAVAGPALGARLRLVRARVERWGAWRAAHPGTTVLAAETGHRHRYGVSPYGDYATSPRLLFPVRRDRRFHPKMPTIGLRVAGGPARAYPAEEIVKAGGRVADSFAGHAVAIAYDEERQVFQVDAPAPVEVVEGYWFAWMAFHPESSVYVSTDPGATGSASNPNHSRDKEDDS